MRSDGTNHAMLINQQCDWDNRNSQKIQGINHDRPIHLLPLHEEPGAVSVLLLDDPHHLNLALVLWLLCCFVPPGHVLTAAGSPGRPDMQDYFLASEVGNRYRTAIVS